MHGGKKENGKGEVRHHMLLRKAAGGCVGQDSKGKVSYHHISALLCCNLHKHALSMGALHTKYIAITVLLHTNHWQHLHKHGRHVCLGWHRSPSQG